jgi:methionyl-tRNA formyltransferase
VNGGRPPYLFAGDRAVGVEALRRLAALGDPPTVLCTASNVGASHAADLRAAFTDAGGEHVLTGDDLADADVLAWLAGLGLQLAVAVQFPHLVRPAALSVPERGWVNVHPAYLPFNRGWHTPSWAILEGTPAGATIHEMAEDVDAGAVIARRRIPTRPEDTADSLYQRLLAAEVELLEATWPTLRGPDDWTGQPQEGGTSHRRGELATDEVRTLDLDATSTVRAVIDRLRALTTSRPEESARFTVDGVDYRIRVAIERVDGDTAG